MMLSIPSWLEIPPAKTLAKAQQFLLQAIATSTREDANIRESLRAVNDMLDHFVSSLVDKQKYQTTTGGELGPILLAVREKDAQWAMVEINKAQQHAIIRQDKREYEELFDVMTMFEEIIEFSSTCNAKGRGKRDMSDAADSTSARGTKVARTG